MKRSSIFLVTLAIMLSPIIAQAQLEVMTYNLRYATARDGYNAWSKRKEDVASLIKQYNPAVLGVQEAIQEQMTFLDSLFIHYAYVGVGRDDGAEAGEFSAIFFDSTKLTSIASETFWLSESPEVPSYGWGANYRRVCTYGSFLVKNTGDTIHIFNTHFDHEVELARLNAAQVILDKLKEKSMSQSLVVLMGDFNCTLLDPPMRRLNRRFEFATTVTIAPINGPKSTFNGFEKDVQEGKVIDHILVKNGIFKTYRHIDDRRPNGLWPSDHLPVLVSVFFATTSD